MLTPTLVWIARIVGLTLLYIPIYMLGAMAVSGAIPDTHSEPGLVEPGVGLLLLSGISVLLTVGLIATSRWRGLKLAGLLALAYYGSFTLMTQIETWFFLSHLTVPPALLPRLFAMGIPVPLLFIPLAVWICGAWRGGGVGVEPLLRFSAAQWAVKLGAIALVYVVIYWLAGYFIAWQNPELRAFYGSPGDIAPFWAHTAHTLIHHPGLLPLQLGRGVLFAGFALPVILGSRAGVWPTAALVGLLLAAPHLGHILANPLMPVASVRLSHMVETASSTFLFGLLLTWVLHRRHRGIRDFFGL